VSHDTLEAFRKVVQMILALGEQDRRATLLESANNIIQNGDVPSFVAGQRCVAF
jgi:hypothetical protein